MLVKKVHAVYFSPAGSTGKVVRAAADAAAEYLSVPVCYTDFTEPSMREAPLYIPPDEMAVFGVPTYAGRVPNKILPFIRALFSSDGAPALSLVTFGNRSFDSSLTELRNELSDAGFKVFGCAALVSRHVFSEKLAPGRPDDKDLSELRDFTLKAIRKLEGAASVCSLGMPVVGDGAPVAPYYTPFGTDGKPVVFLKAKPVTDPSLCDGCGICVKVCPMGCVKDPFTAEGVCIKCHACIIGCPMKARHFEDPAFLSHVAMLEANFTRPAQNAYYGIDK